MTATLLAAVIFAIAGSVAITLYHKSLTDAVWRTVTGTASDLFLALWNRAGTD